MKVFRVRRASNDLWWKVQVKQNYMSWFWHTLTIHDSFKESMSNYYILVKNEKRL